MSRLRPSNISSVVLVSASLLVIAGQASAQVSPFRGAGLKLSKEDFALIEAAGSKLYAVENPKVGATESWSNAKSGNGGTVVLTAVYTWNNMPCRRMSHQIVTTTRKDPYSVQIDRCRTPAGEWKTRY
nr:hypothetical protein [Nitrosomonas nitrosa]